MEEIEDFMKRTKPFLDELNKYPEGIKLIYSKEGYILMVDLKIFE